MEEAKRCVESVDVLPAAANRFSQGLYATAAALFVLVGTAGPLEAAPPSSKTAARATFPKEAKPGPPPALVLVRPLIARGLDGSGDGQLGIVGTEVTRPLSVRVVDREGRPAPSVRVFFSLATAPKGATGHELSASSTHSDRSGLATVRLLLGSKPGNYVVTASLIEDLQHPLTLSVQAMEHSWLLFLAFSLLGGLALFLYGMDMMSNGMKRAAGEHLKRVIGALTGNRFVGLFIGIVLTAIAQSSSATTVILVSFVQARLMSLAQTMGIILGADIGTTFTVQLIAFQIADYSLLLIAVGFGLNTFGVREGVRFGGQIILGAGLIFFGMDIMSRAMYPLRGYLPFIDLLLRLENPIVGIFVGALFTAVIQSSGAFAGILLALAQQGVLSLEGALPPLLGANIGTCVTAALASIRTSREAKRVAVAHTLFKVLGVLLVVGWIPLFLEIVRYFTPPPPGLNPALPEAMARTVPRQLANAHTLFNVGLAVIFLPLTGTLARVVERLVPDEPYRGRQPKEEDNHPQYLDPKLLATPAFALHGAALEILRLSRLVLANYHRILDALSSNDESLLDVAATESARFRSIHQELIGYLKTINAETMRTSRALTAIKFGMIANDLANIERAMQDSILPNVRLKIRGGEDFSSSGRSELFEYARLVGEHFELVLLAFEKRDTAAADRALELDSRIGLMENVNRINHVQRLAEGGERSLRTSEYHLNILEALRRISAHLRSISVQIQLGEGRKQTPADRTEGRAPPPDDPPAP